MSSSPLPILSLSKPALHLNANGEQIKGGEKVTLSQWFTQFSAFIPKWMTEWVQIAAEWMRTARRGLFGLYKEAGWTWDVSLSRCFHQSASATKTESSAHPKCHYCHVFFHLMQQLESSGTDPTVQHLKKCLSTRLKTKHFLVKCKNANSRCTYKTLPWCAINMNDYC